MFLLSGIGKGWRGSRPLASLIAALAFFAPAPAQVITYEGNVFPEGLGWQRLPAGANEGDRRLENGWFIQTLQEHDQDSYRYDIGAIGGLVGRFFVEWRAMTDNPEWLIDEWQTPTVLAAAGRGGVLYHTVMTESAAALYRDFTIPLVVVSNSVGEPHTFRVEMFADEYIWYIDGVVVDSGVPEGPYPDPNAFVIWGAEVTHQDAPPSTTAWDFVRAGRIPDDATGDFNSDGYAGWWDLVPALDCFDKNGPGIFSGPGENSAAGCAFMDFDSDGDTDLRDAAAFQNVYEGE